MKQKKNLTKAEEIKKIEHAIEKFGDPNDKLTSRLKTLKGK
jgi:hypothetical protein